MNLTVRERLEIVQMLPQNGSIMEMIDIMSILKKIRLTQEEKTQIKYKELDNKIMWDASESLEKDITFTHEEITILKDSVHRLDKNKEVNPSNLDICIKINQL